MTESFCLFTNDIIMNDFLQRASDRDRHYSKSLQIPSCLSVQDIARDKSIINYV